MFAEPFQHQKNTGTKHQPGMAAMEDQFCFTATSKQGDPKERAKKSQQRDRKTGSGRRWQSAFPDHLPQMGVGA
ncbi:hypothetical protein MIT1002_02438 [Alteromonas macleodii]|nr:hypothetical protein MIT1002_02438 [Alteromonas macleodii]VTP53469.1 hypothetical protein MIT1002_02438 [Alteromonas macleodii]